MIDLLTRLRGIRDGAHSFAQALGLEDRAVLGGLDVDQVVERAAIMEFDGGVPRAIAEQYALGQIDDRQLPAVLAGM